MIKIYISLKEAEQLAFKKILAVDDSRLKITRAQGVYSVAVCLNGNATQIAEHSNIFMSSIVAFEAPTNDKTVFLNHYKLPLGLLKFKERKVKDNVEPELNLARNDAGCVKDYTHLRRAMVQLYNAVYLLQDKPTLSAKLLSNLNNLGHLSEFETQLISEILAEGELPRLSFKVDNIKPESYFRWMWVAKFASDNIVDTAVGLSEDDSAQHKKWLKGIGDADPKSLSTMLQNVPEQLKEHLAIIIGYYHAVNIERPLPATDLNSDFISHFDYLDTEDTQFNVCFWTMFFKSLFLDRIDYYYPVAPLQAQFLNLEKNAFTLASKFQQKALESELIPINQIDENEDMFIRAYHALKSDIVVDTIKVISVQDVIASFNKSPLFSSNRVNVGIVLDKDSTYPNWPNYMKLTDDSFELKQLNKANNDVVYYGDKDIAPPAFKKMIKPFESIMPKGKKMLFGTIVEDDFQNGLNNKQAELLDLYSRLLRNNPTSQLKDFVFIWEVEREQSEMHDLHFEQQKTNLKRLLEQKLGHSIQFAVKNKNNINDNEIKRFIKNSMGEYKPADVEFIDERVDPNKLMWLVDTFVKYVVKKEQFNYAVLVND